MIEEPVTTITDYILAVETSILGVLLFRQSGALQGRIWSAAFVAFAAGALIGGSFHGFRSTLSPSFRLLLWRGTSVFLMSGVVLMIAGGVFSIPKTGLRNVLMALLGFAWIVLFFRLLGKQQQTVEMPSAFWVMFALVILLACLLLYWYFAGRSLSGTWLLLGSVVSLSAVAVQQSGFAVHRHLNQNDLSHIIFMAGLYFLYRGFRLT